MPKRKQQKEEQDQEQEQEEQEQEKQENAKAMKKGGPKEDSLEGDEQPQKKKAGAAKKKAAAVEEDEEQEEEQREEDIAAAEEGKQPQKKKAAKKKAAEIVLQTERCVLARKPVPTARSFKVVSWNVNGLRGVLSGKYATQNGKKTTNILRELVAQEGGDVDVLFLQETKLQEVKCAEFDNILPGYVAYWSCSKTKKGYAGVAAFVKEEYVRGDAGGGGGNGGGKAATGGKQQTLASFFPAGGKEKDIKIGADAENGAKGKAKGAAVAAAAAAAPDAAASFSSSSFSSSSFEVLNVKYGYVGDKDEDEEGRVVTLEFAGFWLVGVYVANSGMKLERLQHRLKTFNPRFQEFLSGLNKIKPVLVMGDFNVAPLDMDCYNTGAKHLVKVPGLTPEEREAHAAWLGTGWVDTFRCVFAMSGFKLRGLFLYIYFYLYPLLS